MFLIVSYQVVRGFDLSHYWRLHHSTKVVAAKFLHVTLLFFPLEWGSVWRLVLWAYVHVLFLIKLSLTSFYIHWYFLAEFVIAVTIAKWWFSNSIIPSSLLMIFYCKGKKSLFSSLIHSFIHISMDSYFIFGFILLCSTFTWVKMVIVTVSFLFLISRGMFSMICD